VSPAGAVEAARCELAAEFLADLRRIDAHMREAKKKLTIAVRASATTLTEVFGVGPIVAATVIGEVRDVSRFPDRDHFAAYNGTAPIEVSSGRRRIYRLSRRGNRRLNHAVHMAAVTQVSHRHSPGRAYYERKLAEGKTPKEALRSLKRRLSDTIFAQLQADTRRSSAARAESEPRKATGERLHRQRGRLTPQAPALRPSHSRTRRPPYDPARPQGPERQEADQKAPRTT
jgi:transposase